MSFDSDVARARAHSISEDDKKDLSSILTFVVVACLSRTYVCIWVEKIIAVHFPV